MKRLGILGGSFDPIHMGHLILAQAALEAYQLDSVIFLPARLNPYKDQSTMTDAKTRFRMVEIATEDNPRFEVSDLELARPERSYTIDTIGLLKERYLGVEIYFILGADVIMQIEGWMTFKALLKEVVFLVAYRPSHTRAQVEAELLRLNTKYQGDIRLVDFPYIDLSSSYIRETIMRGGSARYLLPDGVAKYIKDMGIYKKNQAKR